MNLELDNAKKLFNNLNQKSNLIDGVEIVIAPPSLYLGLFAEKSNGLSLSSQNISHQYNGAFTGEISSSMLSSMGVKYSIIGHSERRTYQKETNELIFQKAKCLIHWGLIPIFCCGELLEDRNNGNAFDVVTSQLSLLLNNFSREEFSTLVIAYEPVWAIGT
jgi:triosephosphate isomerase